MITKAKLTRLLSDKTNFSGNTDISVILKNHGIKETEEMQFLIKELKIVGPPVETDMISVYSREVTGGSVIRRVYMPLKEINHNEKWFAIANLICELECGEKIWDKSNFSIEQDGATPAELKNTKKFEERFCELIEEAIVKKPEKKEQLLEFQDKVYCLKNAVFRFMLHQMHSYQVKASGKTEADSLSLEENEKLGICKIAKEHSDWLSFANQDEFHYIPAELGETIANRTFSNGFGFWMEFSKIYCL